MSSPWTPVDPREATRHLIVGSPVGELLLTRVGPVITAITFTPFAAPGGLGEDSGFDQVRAQLDEYFAGERTDFDLPLGPQGTPFQLSVWAALLTIPYGETRSYGQMAAALGTPTASRAVGTANGSNPLPIVVPCHRVIGSTGTLTGYSGGLERKRHLLDLETTAPPLLRL